MSKLSLTLHTFSITGSVTSLFLTFLSREEKDEVREFIQKQVRKRYIQPSKSLQTMLVFFVGKKNGKKRIVQDYWYLNK